MQNSQEHHRVFKNRGLRGTFEQKRRKLLNEGIHSLYSLSHIIWVIQSRMKWVGHVHIWER